MADKRKQNAPEEARVKFTAGVVESFQCPPDKQQAFKWDTLVTQLALRATPNGKPSYVFQSRFANQTVRITIGSPKIWGIEAARTKAKELQRLIDEGIDPRELAKANELAKQRREAAEAQEAARKLEEEAARKRIEKARAVTVAEAWSIYIAERRKRWADGTYRDHVKQAALGGVPKKRGKGLTTAAPLAPLMQMRLVDLTAEVIQDWAKEEGAKRPTTARVAWRYLRTFLEWCCVESKQFKSLMPNNNPAATKTARESLGEQKAKQGVLLREQLPAWFDAIRAIQNPVLSVYFQVLLLTGGRATEIRLMRWEDVNLRWKGITIRDKVEGERTIPLTPYITHLLAGLPKRNGWVFSSPTSKEGHISEANHAHTAACRIAGLNITPHDLRRSFKSLSEWLELPTGVVAQIMGHKPSATAEKHYTVRPLDLLRLHHEKFESWILEQAGIAFDGKSQSGKLQAVK